MVFGYSVLVLIFFNILSFDYSKLVAGNKVSDALCGLSTDQLIRYYGYEAEVHEVITEDFYILTVFRCNSKRHSPKPKKPVVLAHGILLSSDDFCINPPDKSLAYMLADAGYDVFIPNSRGNVYSRKNKYKDPNVNTSGFWDFSWYEMGIYDQPAVIGFVLQKTGYPKLYYCGYSQGTTSLIALLSQKPEYNNKIHVASLLAPVAYMNHANKIFESIYEAYIRSPISKLAHGFEFLQRTKLLTGLLNVVCSVDLPLCNRVSNFVLGPSENQWNKPQLITKYGYHVEEHYVTTADGFILQLHRITGSPSSPPRKGKKVCLVAHGIFDSSASFVFTGPQHGLGYLLADNDYDVFLFNARGNTYSANHTSFKPFGTFFDRKRFWSFSWHEIGILDLPASIDYILAETGVSKIHYIGYSQGATAFFVMASERPEYNDKIEMMHALGPAFFLSHLVSPPVRAVVPFLSVLQKLKALIGFDYFKPSKQFLLLAGKLLCRDTAPTQSICENVLFLLLGYNSDQLNSTLLPVIFAHVNASIATNQLVHYGQLVKSGSFRQYDHGFLRNWLKYKRFTPPDYNLKNVKTPVAFYYAQNDWMASVKDVHVLMQHLPYVYKDYLIPHKDVNHIDLLWGTDARMLVFEEILQTMKAVDG